MVLLHDMSNTRNVELFIHNNAISPTSERVISATSCSDPFVLIRIIRGDTKKEREWKRKKRRMSSIIFDPPLMYH